MKNDMEKIKIAYIISELNIAGAEVILCQLVSNLDKAKFEPVVLVLDEKRENRLTKQLDSAGIRSLFMNKIDKNSVIRHRKRYLWINRMLKQEKPDLIHAHLEYYFSCLYALRYSKRLISTIHGQAYTIKNMWTQVIFKVLDRKGLLKLHALTCSGAKELEEIFTIDHKKIAIIPNMIRIDTFRNPDRDYSQKDSVSFIFIARFHPVKNHHMLLQAFSQLLKHVPEAVLNLVGDGELLEKEKEYARSLNIIENVKFWGEMEDVSQILKESDIFVISSDSEMFPIVLLEAMSSGLPVVTTFVGGIRDIMDENGITVEAGNAKQMASAMLRMAEDDELRARYGKKSLKLAEKYDVDRVVKQYEDLYLQEIDLINAKSKQAAI